MRFDGVTPEGLDWHLLDNDKHRGIQTLMRDLNQLYVATPALHEIDFDARGFEWIDCHDSTQSVLSYLRKGDNGEVVIVVLNMTPVPRYDYRIGVPEAGAYREIINSDSEYYGGSNTGNGPAALVTEAVAWMDRPVSLSLTLPPLAAIVLEYQGPA